MSSSTDKDLSGDLSRSPKRVISLIQEFRELEPLFVDYYNEAQRAHPKWFPFNGSSIQHPKFEGIFDKWLPLFIEYKDFRERNIIHPDLERAVRCVDWTFLNYRNQPSRQCKKTISKCKESTI